MKNTRWFFGLAAALFLVSGCVPLAAMGTAGAGTYYFISGVLQADYKHSFDKVWEACEKTLADMRAVDVQPLKEIGKGTINAVVNDEKVNIAVSYKERNVTMVAVRVGVFGDRIASQMLHDKIDDNIAKH